jgi:streptogramin lyase
LALACLAGIAVVVDSTGGKHAPAPTPAVRPDSLVELDAHTGAILADTPLGTTPGLLATIAGRVWVSSTADRTLIEIDPLRGDRIVKTIGLVAAPYRLIASAGALWIANGFDGTLTKVSVPDGAVLPPFRPEPGSTGRLALAHSNGSVWSAAQDGTLTRFDPKTVRPVARIAGIADPEAVAVGAGGVWVGQATQTEIVRISFHTDRRTASIPIGGFATAIATSGDSVWALAPSQDRLWQIDSRTNAVVAGFDVGANASDVLVTGKDVWVVSDSNGTLTRIDPATNSGPKLIQLHYPLGGSTADGNRIWITAAG